MGGIDRKGKVLGKMTVGALIRGSLFLLMFRKAFGNNIILDSSFEESEVGQAPKYWKSEIEGGQGQVVVVNSEKHAGERSLVLSSESSGAKARAIYKFLYAIKPITYLVGVAVKGSSPQIGGYSTRLEMRLVGSKKPVFALMANPPVDVWQGWRVYEGCLCRKNRAFTVKQRLK